MPDLNCHRFEADQDNFLLVSPKQSKLIQQIREEALNFASVQK
jgi:hypothetical protein